MMKFILIGVATFLLSMPSLAAQVDYNKTVKKVAVEANNIGYFRVTEALTLECQYDVIFFSLTDETGKGHLSVLLAAKMSATQISTLAYNKDTSGRCTVSTIEI